MAFFNDWYISLADDSMETYLPLWGVKTHVDATIAEAKTDYQDILGLNGAIDRSEIGAGVKYKNREIKMYLVIRDEDIPVASGFADAQAVYEEFARIYHGQNVIISRSIDGIGDNYQRYKGRLQVAKDSKTKVIRLITCVINAEPFVYFDAIPLNITPSYKEKQKFTLSAAGIVEDGGLHVVDSLGENTIFATGTIGRYAVWNYSVSEDTVIFPYINGNTVSFDIEFFNSDGEPITLDRGGYYSDSYDTIKIKITARTKVAFSVGLKMLTFSYTPDNPYDIINVNNIRMPADIYYANQNEGAVFFLNGATYPLGITANLGEYELLAEIQLLPHQSNWFTVLLSDEEESQTASFVNIEYDNKDLVGVADV